MKHIRDVMLGVLAAAVIGLTTWVFNMHYWQGTIDTKIANIEEDADKIVRLLEELRDQRNRKGGEYE